MVETTQVLHIFRNQSLPKTREELENRAMLCQYLNDIKHLLEIKRQCVMNLTEEQLQKFKPEASCSLDEK